ncbi:nitrous oxide-stimulated promoter family protein [Paenibacillus timonensis]|uniref:Nitrous oxide-stimulated promoter family protein n=1 Tax=Paenibacillus timonensis TaxID=225915 RepID=A0ABW3SER9_9BACL|nr:nitrous oxide-stimulated promoter family protein [Paenibacillus timonensis]MCH1641890.1 nitrous oxide-stimulated promoter family protein [Paenibacillus timonensis]
MASSVDGPRIRREKKTVALMIALYCRKLHGGREQADPQQPGAVRAGATSLCAECAELHRYAEQRLDRCRFGEGKATCLACPVHCYAAAQREQIRRVMAFAGPRMLWRHPVFTLLHLLDGFKKGHSQ